MPQRDGIWDNLVNLEYVLLAHPLVRECGVVGGAEGETPIEPLGRTPRQGEHGPPNLAAELEAFVRSQLALSTCPGWIERAAEPHRSASDEVQCSELREHAAMLPRPA